MHKIQGWTGLRSAVFALGLVAWTATGATAAPLTATTTPLNYTTSVQVDPSVGVTGTNVISFVPLTNNSVDLAAGHTNVGLGNFVEAALPAGVSTTYTNTPFQINFLPASYGSDTSVVNDPAVVASGVLNGSVTGGSSSTVTANPATLGRPHMGRSPPWPGGSPQASRASDTVATSSAVNCASKAASVFMPFSETRQIHILKV